MKTKSVITIPYLVIIFCFLLGACSQSGTYKDHKNGVQTGHDAHSGHRQADSEDLVYYCSMCPGQEQFTPGQCKVCGMDLITKEKQESDRKSVYTCPMHSEIQQVEPGSCPICKMDLVVNTEAEDSLPTPKPLTKVMSNAEYVKVSAKSLPVTIKSHGLISFNTELIHNISVKAGGRIEEVFARHTYQYIKSGDPLFSVYSHELVDAQQNYLFIRKNDDDSKLLKAARDKLLLLGLTDEQIEHLDMEHYHSSIIIYSPYEGYLLEKNDNPSIQSMNMGSGLQAKSSQQPVTLKKGTTVKTGETLFKLASTESVWVVFEIKGPDLPLVNKGQKVRIFSNKLEKPTGGTVDLVEPQIDPETGNGKVRIVIPNPENLLKPGDFAEGEIISGLQNGLWVPQSAVADLGTEKVAFVKDGNYFIPKKVKTGVKSATYVMITEGLTEEESVAKEANLLIDSESIIKP